MTSFSGLLGGEALYRKVHEETNNNIGKALAQIKQLGCFVAGTLVHTRKGLKPIEEIKAGDYVFFRHKNGEGGLYYQPVTKTYEYDSKELYFVPFATRIPNDG